MPKNVFNDVFILSEKQEQLMEILWKSDKSLTSMDIMQILNDPHADYTYVVRMLSLLEKNHMISEVGTVPSGKKRARLFVPALTRCSGGCFRTDSGSIWLRSGIRRKAECPDRFQHTVITQMLKSSGYL